MRTLHNLFSPFQCLILCGFRFLCSLSLWGIQMWISKVPLQTNIRLCLICIPHFIHSQSQAHFSFSLHGTKSQPQGLISFSSWRTAVSAGSLASCHLMLRNHADRPPFSKSSQAQRCSLCIAPNATVKKRKSIRIFLHFSMGWPSSFVSDFRDQEKTI